MKYDDSNIFNKILNGIIPCDSIYEDEEILCFKDINPIATVHVLIIAKEKYISFDDFISNANEKLIVSFFKKIKFIAKKLNINNEGYRIISNHGSNANQEVPHFHVHLVGGQNLGGIKAK